MAMPEPAPAVGEQAVVGEQRLEHVHLQLEPVRFLGVDGQMDVGRAGLGRELAEDRQDVGLRLVRVAPLVARVERRQLHRNAGRLLKPPFASLAMRSSALR